VVCDRRPREAGHAVCWRLNDVDIFVVALVPGDLSPHAANSAERANLLRRSERGWRSERGRCAERSHCVWLG